MKTSLQKSDLAFKYFDSNHAGTLQAVSTYNGDRVILLNKSYVIRTNFWKRAFDMAFASLFIIFIFSWLFPIIALLVKYKSKGPVLFIQDRIGLDGTIFKCYKFRTMKAEIIRNAYTPTQGKDSRITPIGHFLRDSSLDELPQFINVLKGNMSIVGPRPHAIAFHETYSSFIEDIDDRLLVKPGITGLAQIRGYRGDVRDYKENIDRTKKRIAFDVRYIKSWSLKMDVWVVYTTFMQVLGLKQYGQK